MITADLEKLGLTGCDIQEYESNRNCEVVIDVHTRRLVALQPGDALEAFKKSATAEWLCNHLSKMNRRSLYSRVITSASIRLEDISQLATRIDDESEKTVDHILAGHQMESGDAIIQSVLPHVNSDGVKNLIVKSWESKRDVISLYTLIQTIDESLTGKLLPYVKAVTHQCMMMEDDSPYCLLEDRYLECARILRQDSPRDDSAPDLVRLKCDCIHKLVVLREIWSRTEAAEWDQIKEFPKAPVALEQDEHLKELQKAEKAREEARKAENILEEAGKGQKEATHRPEEPPEAQENIKTVHRTSPREAGKAEDASKQLAESGISTARDESLDNAEVETKRHEPEGQESLCTICLLAQLQQQLKMSARPDQQQTVHKAEIRITQAAGQHRETSELRTKEDPVVVPAAASSGTDNSVSPESKGAIPKKARSQPANPAASVSDPVKIVDQETLSSILARKCNMAHADTMKRVSVLSEYIKHPRREESRQKALEVISQGYWPANILDDLLVMASTTTSKNDKEENPFVSEYHKLFSCNAFQRGISPWFDKKKGIPFFDLEQDRENQTSFILRQECQPSRAIIACREQLFMAGSSCFFQVLLYETVLEVLGEEAFDWYYSRDESRLKLTPDNPISVDYTHNNPDNPITSLLTNQAVRKYPGKEKTGSIKILSSVSFQPTNYVNKPRILCAICTDKKEHQYLIPAYCKITKTKVKEVIAFEIMQESMVLYRLDDNSYKDLPNNMYLRAQDNNGIQEYACRLEWDRIIKIKGQYNKHIRAQAAERDKAQYAHKKEERQRYKRRPKKESLPANASEQPPLVTAFDQSLPRALPASTHALPFYQDKPGNFAEAINKLKTNLVRYRRDYEEHTTAENRDRLVSAIEAVKDIHKKLKTTSEIDDDTRNTLDRRINGALNGAQKVLDKHADTT